MKEIVVPELAESITEGTVAEWLVSKGDTVSKGDPVVELETDKVNVEVNSDFAGVIAEVLVEEGDDVEVGDVIAKVDESGEAAGSDDSGSEEPKEEKKEEKKAESKEEPKEAEAKEESPKTDEDGEKADPDQPVASPATRKRARELGIDLSEIKPKDPVGRISKEDVEAAAKAKADSGKKKSQKEDKSAEKTEFDKPVVREKMSRRRQTIAKRLVEAQHNAAMLTTFNEVDMTEMMKVRSERKDAFLDKHGVKLGFMSFFTKAVVGALKEFPLVNAEIQGDEIVKKQFYDIGVAVSTEEGLVVPVVRDADRLSFAGIESEIGDLAKKARDGKLGLNDLQGGSFTITNGGIFGSLLSTPIINAPQVGILGMHKIEKRPKVMPDDSIEVRPMMYIAMSYDHRIIDGREAVQFLDRVKQMVEDPYDLLLEG